MTRVSTRGAKAPKKVEDTSDESVNSAVDNAEVENEEELTIEEAKAIIAEAKALKAEGGPRGEVYNGKTVYAVFTKDHYGDAYQEVATKFAKDRNFSVRFI